MATSAQEIISYIEKNYPFKDPHSIRNISDINIETKITDFRQYIIGITPADRFTPGIERYEYSIREQFAAITNNIKCLPWSFEVDVKDQLKQVAEELSAFFNAKLEIDRMLDEAFRTKTNRYYIVITVISVPLLYAE